MFAEKRRYGVLDEFVGTSVQRGPSLARFFFFSSKCYHSREINGKRTKEGIFFRKQVSKGTRQLVIRKCWLENKEKQMVVQIKLRIWHKNTFKVTRRREGNWGLWRIFLTSTRCCTTTRSEFFFFEWDEPQYYKYNFFSSGWVGWGGLLLFNETSNFSGWSHFNVRLVELTTNNNKKTPM